MVACCKKKVINDFVVNSMFISHSFHVRFTFVSCSFHLYGERMVKQTRKDVKINEKGKTEVQRMKSGLIM